MTTEFLSIFPVLPSSDIERDITWYKEKTGFEVLHSDKMYAVLFRDKLCIHLQWHAGTKDDPLGGGSVIRICVKDIKPCLMNSSIEVQWRVINSEPGHPGIQTNSDSLI